MLDVGVSSASHHEGLHARTPHYNAIVWGLSMGRDRLYARIDARVDAMMSEGLLEEVARLAKAGLSTKLTAGQAIGYKELLDALEGACSLDEAVALVKRRSRRYAKRQLSWFRHDRRVRWLDLDAISIEEACDQVVAAISGKVA